MTNRKLCCSPWCCAQNTKYIPTLLCKVVGGYQPRPRPRWRSCTVMLWCVGHAIPRQGHGIGCIGCRTVALCKLCDRCILASWSLLSLHMLSWITIASIAIVLMFS